MCVCPHEVYRVYARFVTSNNAYYNNVVKAKPVHDFDNESADVDLP